MTAFLARGWNCLRVALIVTFLLSLAGAGGEARAAFLPGISFETARTSVKTGEVLKVNLHIEGLAANLLGFNAVIGFDPWLVRLEGVEKPAGGSILDPLLLFFSEPDNSKGLVEISAVREGPAREEAGDVFTLNFRFLQEGQLSVDFLKVQLRDSSNQTISLAAPSPLRITIASAGDGESPSAGSNLGGGEASSGGSIPAGEGQQEGTGNGYPGPQPLPGQGIPGKTGEQPSTGPASVLIEFRIGSLQSAVNGQIFLLDAAPYLHQNRTFLPLRFVAGVLGAEVSWEAEPQKVLIVKGDVHLELAPGSNVLIRGEDKTYMDVAPVLVPPGRVMLPIRFVAEALGAVVGWDTREMRVTISLGH